MEGARVLGLYCTMRRQLDVSAMHVSLLASKLSHDTVAVRVMAAKALSDIALGCGSELRVGRPAILPFQTVLQPYDSQRRAYN